MTVMMMTSDALYLQTVISPVSGCPGNAVTVTHAGRGSEDRSEGGRTERERKNNYMNNNIDYHRKNSP